MWQVITHHFVQLDPEDEGSEVEMAVGVVVQDGHPAVTRNPKYFARLDYGPADPSAATAPVDPTRITAVRRTARTRRGSATT